jgi:predicted transposase YbfD/YdcC
MNRLEENGFLDYFEDLEDPRLDRKKLYPINEILLTTLLSIICGADSWNDIELFGKAKISYLRQFLPYANGVPSDDTFRRFFRRINPEEFRSRFVKWMKTFPLPANVIIALDGKVSRHTFDGDEKAALHMVSAFASEMRLVLAQMAVPDKTNEIKAIPELLDWLDICGAIITIDAMGCQREIAQKIINKGGDYVLALKGNQELIATDVEKLFTQQDLLEGFGYEESQTVDGDHGRIETRRCRAMLIPEVLKRRHSWPGLNSIVEIYSIRELKDKVEEEKRYYLTSLPQEAKKLNHAIRQHWGIENSLHHVLDISFRDDESRIRKGNAPENIAIIKHAALNLLQKSKGPRESIKALRKIAAWDENRLSDIFNKIL